MCEQVVFNVLSDDWVKCDLEPSFEVEVDYDFFESLTFSPNLQTSLAKTIPSSILLVAHIHARYYVLISPVEVQLAIVYSKCEMVSCYAGPTVLWWYGQCNKVDAVVNCHTK